MARGEGGKERGGMEKRGGEGYPET